MIDVNDFSKFRIGLAGSDDIRGWSHGEVKKPETINYRTLKPEKDGLFCEKIFGPARDWECQCGRYKRVRFKGIICERCGVEVTRSKVRRERMGHIEMASPVAHIWYLRGTRSWMTYLLMDTDSREDLKATQLEKVIYFSAYLIISVDEDARTQDMPEFEAEVDDLWRNYSNNCRIYRNHLLSLRDLHYLRLEAELAEMEGDAGADSKDSAAASKLREEYDRTIKKIAEEIESLSAEIKEVAEHRLDAMRSQAKRLEGEIEEASGASKKNIAKLLSDALEEINDKSEQIQAQLDVPEGELKPAEPVTDDGEADLAELIDQLEDFRTQLASQRQEAVAEERYLEDFAKLRPRQVIEDQQLHEELDTRFGELYVSSMGAEAILELIDQIDFEDEEERIRKAINPTDGKKPLSGQRREKAIKRLEILSAFNSRDDNGRLSSDPRSIILNTIPVIPPDLRPMVQLDGGRFATSDLNDLYRRVINRNNRLKKLLEIGAPNIIVNNEKRMLQKSIDALFDNGRRSKPVMSQNNRPLKSLSDMLKGKQGRFRLNLLGKRVDYSGRSVIVAGPSLKFHQCGIPRLMALELFKPFMIRELERRGIASYIKSAKRMVEDTISGRARPVPTDDPSYSWSGDDTVFQLRSEQVWDVLNDVVKEHPVLLNRAPTLHRLGIQAFEPVLVHGKAIRLHPLVCTAFNADFDGDQMAVHLPLSSEARAEAEVLMLSAHNLLSPSNGRPLVTPTQDMIIGAYYLTQAIPGSEGEGRVFRTQEQVERAVEEDKLSIHALIDYRSPDLLAEGGNLWGDSSDEAEAVAASNGAGSTASSTASSAYVPTTAGRVIFNQVLPEGFPFVNEKLDRRQVGALVEYLAYNYSRSTTADSLDGLKSLCFRWASRSGITVSVDDIKTPPSKTRILERSEEEAEKVERNFSRGIITDSERRQQEVEIWTEATNAVRQHLETDLQADPFNPVDMMIRSGARSNMMQVRQIAGMRGLVANPRGDMIPRPIKSNFKEGLSTLEYFISTPGARKGLVDTALRTADSGYLTRRLVDVAQEVIINNIDPFDSDRPVPSLLIGDVRPDTPEERTHLESRLFGRVIAQDVELSDGTVYPKGEMVTREIMEHMRDDPDVSEVRVLSPLTDDSEYGISAMSYGISLATGKLIEVGEAVGVIAAQSIGEPGTQLTMRTFHTGGVVGKDLADGLPRVVELFEARSPKGKAVVAGASGTVRITEDESSDRTVTIFPMGETEGESIIIPRGQRLEVEDGQEVVAGDVLVEGPLDPKELLSIKGIRATQQYLVDQVQKVYREQGVSIHDKHIEIIVRQMTRRIIVDSSGDSEFLSGAVVDARKYRDVNRQLMQEGRTPASGRPEIMGITKASLATDSWLAAASFQETTRVLTAAAIASRSDDLKGLKENIVIGKLIPAGTGVTDYREIAPEAPDYVPMESFVSDEEELRRILDPDGEMIGEGGHLRVVENGDAMEMIGGVQEQAS